MENKKRKIDRRNFLGGAATAAAGFTFLPGNVIKGIDESGTNGFQTRPSEKPLPIFNVCNFGVIGDGVTMNTKAFQTLIDSCSNNGGGTLFFPPGDFLTGTFSIKNNVNIYLSPGATVWGSKNRSDYSQGCLVYAEDAKNISITGMGTINGNGKSFWEELRKQKISEEQMREKCGGRVI